MRSPAMSKVVVRSVLLAFSLFGLACSPSEKPKEPRSPTTTRQLALVTPTTNASSFNGTAIPAGRTIWFSSVMKVSGVGTAPARIYFNNAHITFTAGGVSYDLPVPDAEVTLTPGATTATTSFNTSTNAWQTFIPKQFSGSAFLTALAFPVTTALPGGINPVTWTGTFQSDTPGLTVQWQWAAAVYTTFSTNYNAVNVKPVDGNSLSVYQNSDHSGTPEAFKSYVVGGARGGGGSNYTGSLSGTVSVNPPVLCTGVVCSASDQCHDAGTCNPRNGICSSLAKEDGLGCSDGNACTQIDTCQAGTCAGASPVTCTASDSCHLAGACVPATGLCTNPPKANGIGCSDGNFCTQTDTCQAGTCTGANPIVCARRDDCHAVGTCDVETGICSSPNVADGTACTDSNVCTQTDTCQIGNCVGTNPVMCVSNDTCHTPGACDPSSGACGMPVPTGAASCNGCASIPAGLTAWWPGDSTAADAFGGNHGVLRGDVTFAPGLVGSAFSFDGDGDFVEIPDAPGLNVGDGEFSLSVWVKMARRDWVVGKYDAATGQGWYFGVNGNGGVKLPGINTGDLGIPLDTWVHLAARRRAGTMEVFINGDLRASGGAGNLDSSAPITIGHVDGTGFFEGQIDELQYLVGRALTNAEIASIASAGASGMCKPSTWQCGGVTCPAADGCNTYSCAPSTGTCAASPRPDGTACVDSSACTQSDTCQAGTCVGSNPVVCSSNDSCHTPGTCEPSSGMCTLPVPTGAASCNGCASVPGGITAWWPGDATSADLVGAHEASLQGDATYAPGLVGPAFAFDGDGDSVEVPHAPALNLGDGDFSIAMWVNFNRTDGELQMLAAKGNDGGQGWQFGFQGGYLFFQSILSPELAITAGAWTHLVLRRQGGMVGIYVNGQFVMGGGENYNWDTEIPLRFGRRVGDDDRGFWFDGKMDEIQYLVGRSLTDAEIAAMASAGASGVCKPASWQCGSCQTSNPCQISSCNASSGTCTYSSRADGTNCTDGSLCTQTDSCQSGACVGSNPVSCGAGADQCHTAGACNPATGVCSSTPTEPPSGGNGACVGPSCGLVSWWAGDGNANDIQGGNAGDLQGGVTFEPGKVGQAFAFYGGGLVNIGHPPSLNLTNGNFTVDTWVYFNATDGDVSLVDKMAGTEFSGNADGWRLLRQSDGRLWFCIGRYTEGGCGGDVTLYSTTQPQPGIWYHVAVVKAGNVGSMYVNGVLEATHTFDVVYDTGQPDLALGGSAEGGSFLDGKLDEVGLFSAALTASEVAAIYNAGAYGKCKPTPSLCTGMTCVAQDACHQAGVCDTATGICSNPPSQPPPMLMPGQCQTVACTPANGWYLAAAAAGTSCADSNQCNGYEACDAMSACLAGTALQVDDYNSCTADACDATLGVTHSPLANGTSCTDGNFCTQTDTCQGGACAGGNPVTCTATQGCTTAGMCDPGTGMCSASSGCGSGTCNPLADTTNPTARWSAEGNAVDSVGGYNGTMAGGATFAAGKVGQGFALGGAGAHVSIPNADIFDLAQGISVSTWIKVNSHLGPYDPVVKGSNGYALEFANSELGLWLFVSGQWRRSPGATIALGEWAHVATTYDGTRIRLYINGAEVGSGTAATGTVASLGSALWFGGDPSNLDRHFNGLIDEVSLYERALIPAEVSFLAGNTGPTIDDGNPCTTDGCNANGAVFHAPVANGTACSDSNVCTQIDACQSGVCVGTNPVQCTTPAGCTVASTCNQATGSCTVASGCPAARCGDGVISSGLRPTAIDFSWLAAGCEFTGIRRSFPVFLTVNGNYVKTVTVVFNGYCSCQVPITTVHITDPWVLNLLTEGANTFGLYANTSVDSYLSWSVATVHTDTGSQDVIISDSSGGARARAIPACVVNGHYGSLGTLREVTGNVVLHEECDDSNTVSGDACSSSCLTEGCQNARLDPGEECDDGNGTSGDGCTPACQIEKCFGVVCAADECHPGGTCDPDTGLCPTKADGTACHEGSCLVGETCQSGQCRGGTARVCANTTCIAQAHCDPVQDRCAGTPQNQGLACEDGNACTAGDTCSSGTCMGGAPPLVDDGNPCTADSCDATGGVTHAPIAAGTSCTDGNVCNGVETCNAAGACQAETPTPPSMLTPGTCETVACADNTWYIATSATGTLCADDTQCNGTETCDAMGACLAGTPPQVDDFNVCTVDSCDAATGVAHVPLPPGTPVAVWDDGNPCTADSCDAQNQARHVPVADGTTCGAGDACNAAAVCQAGLCRPANLLGGRVAAWHFDSSHDDVLGGSPGLLVGYPVFTYQGDGRVTSYVSGRFGDALHVEDTSHARIENTPAVDVTGTDLSLSLWVKPATNNYKPGGIIHKQFQFSLQYQPDGRVLYADSSNWCFGCDGEETAITPGVWNHLAVVRGGGRLKIYVNGSLTTDVARAGAITSVQAPLQIGCETVDDGENCHTAGYYVYGYAGGDPGRKFVGDIDEVGIWNRPLAGSEIAFLAASAQAPAPGPVPPVQLSDERSAGWRFDESSGTTAADIEVGSPGTLVGATFVDGRFGRALHVDGPDHVRVANTPAVDVTGTKLTLAMWVKPDADATVGGGLIHKERQYGIFYDPDGHVRYADSTNWCFGCLGTQATITPGEWSHIATVQADGRFKFYVNGQLVTDIPRSGSLSTVGKPLQIGMHTLDDGETLHPGTRFQGDIDEVGIWSRELSASEIAYLAGNVQPPPTITTPNPAFKVAAGRVAGWRFNRQYQSFSTHELDIMGKSPGYSTTFGGYVPGRFGNAFRITNSAEGHIPLQYFQLDSTTAVNTITTDLTLSVWVKPDVGPNGGGIIYRPKQYALTYDADGHVKYGDAPNWCFGCRGEVAKVVPGQWNHVVAVRGGGRFQFYVNGKQVADVARDTGAIPPTNTPWIAGCLLENSCSLGSCSLGCKATGVFRGEIDDVGIWGRTLDAGEVEYLATNPQPPAVNEPFLSPPIIAPGVSSDDNPCTADSCDPNLGVMHTQRAEGTSCSDRNVCNGLETCDGLGVCRASSGMPLVLDDGNNCTTDSCDPVSGALHTSLADFTACGDVCTGETCQQGACRMGTPLADGASCGDGNQCNGTELCQQGACRAGAPPQPPSVMMTDMCRLAVCTVEGGWQLAYKPTGTRCADGNRCNGQESCDPMGICLANESPPINDGNSCMVDNWPPIVEAGSDLTVVLPTRAVLAGIITDDGLPDGVQIAASWVQMSGPGTAIFIDPSTTQTEVIFDLPGTYVLRLAGSDSHLTASDDVVVVVQPPAGHGFSRTGGEPPPGETLVNVVRDGNYMALRNDAHPFNFFWVAVSSEGTVVKIDTKTGGILGKYRTAPFQQPSDPSRTTVDKSGNVWAANRAGNSVIRIGLLENEQCIDRNGNGVIDTSAGLDDIRDWTNAGGVDTNGGVSTAEDECILNYVRVSASGTRHVSVDSNNDVWVSGNGAGAGIFDLIDGRTGVIKRTEGPVGAGGYGGLIDKAGVIWSSPGLRWDTALPLNGPEGVNWKAVGVNYGVCIDPQGNVWSTGLFGGIVKLSPSGQHLGSFNHGWNYSQGCVVDMNGHVWVSHSRVQGSTVGHLKPDGSWVGNVLVGAGPSGVAVDGAGKIWSTNYWDGTVSRIDPNAGPLGPDGVTRVGQTDFTSIELGGILYNYSDMTGSTLNGAPDNGTWSFVFDSTQEGAPWGTLNWSGRVCGDASLTVKVATSADGNKFGASVTVRNGQDFNVPSGRHLKTSVSFKRSSQGQSPLLYGLTGGTAQYLIEPVANRSPEVTAGPNRTVTLPNLIRVTGSACDDGLPNSDGLALAWSKVSGPGDVSFATPSAEASDVAIAEPGTYVLRLRASDSALEGQAEVTLNVLRGNKPPVVMVSTPLSGATSQPIALGASVSDDGLPAGSTVTSKWTLVNGPGTALFADDTRPDTSVTFGAGGSYLLRLTASDGHVETRADVSVVIDGVPPPANDPPVVMVPPSFELILPARTAVLNGGVSDDGRPVGAALTVTWLHVSGPSGAVIGNPNVALTNVTLPAVPGTHVFSLSASDSLLTTTATMTITVNGVGVVNRAPQVSAGANVSVVMPATDVPLIGSATDDGLPAGSVVTTVWNQISGPTLAAFTHRTAATTTASFPLPGTYVLELVASDSQYVSAANVQVKVLPYVANQAPLVTVSGPAMVMLPPGTAALSGGVYDDGLPVLGTLGVTWTTVSGPGEVTFSRPNAVSTTATFGATGAYVLALTANDSEHSTSAQLAVTVARPNLAPVVNAGADQDITLPTRAVMLAGSVTDDGEPVGAMVTPRWSVVSGPGSVVFGNALSVITPASFDSPGTYVLRLSANDTVRVGFDDVTITVNPQAPVGDPPTVAITGPQDLVNVTAPTAVIGTVTSDSLLSWRLEYRDKSQTDEWHTLATGDTPVTTSVLAMFDPTILQNGIYQLRLVATDMSGRVAMTPEDAPAINVRGNFKVGQFTLSFQELSIPVSGIPIQLIRNYDSRDVRKSDFGYGWTLDASGIRVSESGKMGRAWGVFRQPGVFPVFCVQATRGKYVTVSIPGGKTFEFEAVVKDGCEPGFSPSVVTVGFQARSGTNATLTPLDGGTVTVLEGELLDANASVYDPDTYVLTLLNGQEFVVSDRTAQDGPGLKSIKDLNGNTVTFGNSGITHSSGKSVFFTRDGENRISSITDPSGSQLTYGYDVDGNLASVTDQVGNVTKFKYHETLRHHLMDVIDPRGVRAVRNTYEAGRLVSQTDAAGKTTAFTHNIDLRKEIVVNRNGDQAIYEYDVRGNVTRQVDEQGGVTLRTYDAHDNELTKTDPNSHTWTNTYDAQDNLASVTDPLGAVTSMTYNLRGQVISTTNPLGNLTPNNPDDHKTTARYDIFAMLIETKDALGNTSTINRYPDGNIGSEVDAAGRATGHLYNRDGFRTRTTDKLGNVTGYGNDASGRVTSETRTRTTPTGVETLVTTMVYDGKGRVTETHQPDGSVLRTTYNAIGMVATQVDALGRTTAMAYDDTGRLINTTYPDGTKEEVTYDPEGRRKTSKDRADRTTTFDYDRLGRLKKTTYPDNTFTQTGYDPAGRQTTSTSARNGVTTFEYFDDGRRKKMTDPVNNVTEMTYDVAGRQLTQKDGRGFTTTFVYDDAGRRTRTTFPDTTFTETTYDAVGRRLTEKDQAGKVTGFGYDFEGRLLTVTDALNQITRHAYDEAGSRVSQTDANMHVTRFEYDKLGRQTKRVLPDGKFELMSHDGNGNVLSRRDFMGRTTTYTHDLSDRMTQRRYPDGTVVSFTYTATGARETATDARGITAYGRDNRDRVTSLTYPDGRALGFGYNADGSRSSLAATIGATTLTTGYGFDLAGRMTTVTDPGMRAYTLEHDAVGHVSKLIRPNGTETRYTFDNLERLTHVSTVSTMTMATLSSFHYTLGATGIRTRLDEFDGTARVYEYDDLYRLKKETVTSPGPNYVKTFGYDQVSNRMSQVTTGTGAASVGYTYDSRDRLLTENSSGYTWDDNGNLLTKTGGDVYTWDFDDRLKKVTKPDGTVIEHVYDVDGNRVQSKATPPAGSPSITNYLVDTTMGLSHVVAETDGTGALGAYYVRDGGQLLAVLRGGDVRYYVADGLGSVRELRDGTGAATDTYSTTAFGESLTRTGTDGQPYGFAGEAIDQFTGLSYNRARWMDPRTGTFLTYDHGPPTGYRYVHNDPVNFTDPSGYLEFSLAGLVETANIYAIQANLYLSSGTVGAKAILTGVAALNMFAFLQDPNLFISFGPAATLQVLAGDAALVVSGGIKLGTAADAFLVNAAKATPIPGILDVAVHGTELAVWLDKLAVNHRVLARLIQGSGEFAGQGIRLVSCNTGTSPVGVAQNLANKLGVPVWAPNDIIWAYPDGTLTIGALPGVNSGSWVKFLPGGR